MRTRRIIYIYGPDGSGKSTICHELIKLLKDRDVEATYKWMRFNHYCSKVVNFIAYHMKLSCRVVYPDNTKVGYHHYYKSWFISMSYSLTTIIDTLFSTVFRLWIPLLANRKVVVLDRFVFDIIVDLSVDMKKPDLLTSWQGNFLKKFLPSKTIPIYIETDKDIIHKRRPDTQWDENFTMRLELYKNIYKTLRIGYKVDNNSQLNVTLESIAGILESNEKETSSAAV